MKQIKAYKGFDKDLKCRGFQYEIGKTYHHDGPVELCKNGFHAIHENPLSVFAYYPPAESRYCEVLISGETYESEAKIVGSDITIIAEIGIDEIIKAHEEWVKRQLINESEYKVSDEENRSSASNKWVRSLASNTGKFSIASNAGHNSSATSTGLRSLATNTGDDSSANSTGNHSSASNTGEFSSAINKGDFSSASCTGNGSVANNEGDYSLASSIGSCSLARNAGNCSLASSVGFYSLAEASGKNSVAIATGKKSRVRGSLGCAIVAVERGAWNGFSETYPLVGICSAIVDGVKIKADTWYTVKNGQFVEVNEIEED